MKCVYRYTRSASCAGKTIRFLNVWGKGVYIFVIPTSTRQQEDPRPGGNNNVHRFFSTFHSHPYILLQRLQYYIPI